MSVWIIWCKYKLLLSDDQNNNMIKRKKKWIIINMAVGVFGSLAEG